MNITSKLRDVGGFILGENKTGVVFPVTVPAGSGVQLCGPSLSRARVAFSWDQATVAYISNDPMAAAGQGIPILVNGGLYEFCVTDYGTATKKAWFMFSANIGTCGVALVDYGG